MNVFRDADTREERWKKAVETFNSGDYAGALYLFKSFAAEGSTAAYVEIGNIYELGGNGVERDYVEARRWYGLAANKAGEPKAYIALAKLHYFGEGGPIDLTKALDLYKKAAAVGEPGAMYVLGHMHRFGVGVARDYGKASEYFRRAADAGHALALRDLALVTVKLGRWREGISLWFRAFWQILRIARVNPDDWRLRAR